MDFGLARSVASCLTSKGTIVGTVYYLAPEQALDQGIDERTDLYSLGVMLDELTTGEMSFIADELVVEFGKHGRVINGGFAVFHRYLFSDLIIIP